jgi:hypothetical protein
MAHIDELRQQLPIADLAARLGVDETTASQAVNQAIPALLGGLRANAEDPAGAESIADALQQHDPSLVEGGVNLDDVDESDGEKIVGHVFGAKKEQVARRSDSRAPTACHGRPIRRRAPRPSRRRRPA